VAPTHKKIAHLLFALALGVLGCNSASAHQRMSVSFRYRGEVMTATFFSNLRTASFTNAAEFAQTADFLDRLRLQNYAGRNRDMSDVERADLERGFFRYERLRDHDEVLVLHRGNAPLIREGDGQLPLGIGENVLGLIAVDRLGDPSFMQPVTTANPAYETLLLEKRLSPLAIRIPRPPTSQWIGNELPPGVFPHWDPFIRQTYFQPGRILYGDVIQANALFAQEGLWPLLHSLANTYGLFSTGRLISNPTIIDGIQYNGPSVCIPTLVVWEVFNKYTRGQIHKGSRTIYYERANARPLVIQGYNQWRDPYLNFDSLVQVFYKTGAEFREGWTELFAARDNFSFVRDVRILETRIESVLGRRLEQNLVSQSDPAISHHPHEMDSCVHKMLQARQQNVVEVSTPLTIGISIGNVQGPEIRLNLRHAYRQ
jgi:hypothetical protein